MTTQNIEVIPVEQPSSHVNAKVKLNSSSNAHNLKSQSMTTNTSSMMHKGRRTRDMTLTYDVSMTLKIQIAKYTVCLLFLLLFTLLFVRSRIFHSIPFSIRLLIAFAAFTSMAIVTSVLIIYFATLKSTSMLYASLIAFK